MDTPAEALPPDAADLYRLALRRLQERGVPFLVGGGYAFTPYTGISRHTNDLDLFVRRADLDRAFETLEEVGCDTELTYPHWLGKAHYDDHVVDLIFATGNGVSEVNDAWFDRAPRGEVLGVPVRLCAPEDILWTKAFIQERERYDGADVAHLVLHADLDWDVLLEHFGTHWRVLLAHLVLFGFVYPTERDRIPRRVMEDLMSRLRDEGGRSRSGPRVCNGPLLSRAQYLVDVEEWGFEDGRLRPENRMASEDVEAWTDEIPDEDLPDSSPSPERES
jgi:hypothetical protein